MNKKERQELMALRVRVSQLLNETEQAILEFPPRGNDADFRFLVNKAISYRGVLHKIDEDLKEES